MLKSSLCRCSDTLKGTSAIAEAGTDVAARQVDKRSEQWICKICTPLTDYISKINNNPVDNTKYLDVANLWFNGM